MGANKIVAPPFHFMADFTTSDFNHAGWSEAGWILPTMGPDLVSARNKAGLWAAARLALALPDVIISQIRVWSTQQVYRGAGLLAFLGVANVGTYVPSGMAESKTLPPDAKLLQHQQFEGPPALGVSEFIGGVPDNVISPTGFYAPDAAFTTNMAAYVTFLKANCAFVRKALLPPHAVAWYPINDVQTFGILRSRKTGRPFPIDHAMDLRT